MTDLLTATNSQATISPPTAGDAYEVVVSAMAIAQAPDHLVSVLGSCLALVLFDPFAGLAGMAHVLLPDSRGERSGSAAKYADTAVPALIEALVSHGAQRARLRAQITGGARLFDTGVITDIGSANVRAISGALAKARIPVAHLDVGGGHGRQADFDIASGRLHVSPLAGAARPVVGP